MHTVGPERDNNNQHKDDTMTDPPIDSPTYTVTDVSMQLEELMLMVNDLHQLMKEQVDLTGELVSLVEEVAIVRVEPTSKQSPFLS